jgi:hypothetical protein
VRHDIRLFRNSPLVRKELRENSYAFVYDIKTGGLTAAEPQADKQGVAKL